MIQHRADISVDMTILVCGTTYTHGVAKDGVLCISATLYVIERLILPNSRVLIMFGTMFG